MNIDRMSIHLLKDAVQIETVKDGRKTLKNTNLENVQQVLTRNVRIETPFLPGQYGMHKYIKNNSRELYAFSTAPHIREVKFDFRGETGERENRPYIIPVPAFLWFVTVDHNAQRDTRKYIHGMVYALKNPLLSERDRLYRWPFANVSTYMCWGRDIPPIGQPKSLQTIPDQFLSNPFNSDLDGGRFESFDDVVKGKTINRFRCMHLFEYLDRVHKEALEKGEESQFKYDCLRPEATFKDALQQNSNYLR